MASDTCAAPSPAMRPRRRRRPARGCPRTASWRAAASAGSAPAQALATKHGVGDVLVTEARARPSGNITTVERAEEGYLWEEGPNSFQPSDPVLTMAANESEAELTKVTSKVYFDITIDGKPTGRTVMGFFGNTVPKTAGEKGVGKSGKPLYYKGTTFHRIIPGFMIQGGDTANGNGTGCDSTYGSIFPDENFKINHSAPELGRSNRLLIMGYSLCCCYRLDGNHVVFGKVLSGMGVVYKIEAEGTQTGAPRCKVVISDSGELK
ncbi:hypothetical protein E2562_006606 [Oryza meyeriana var. granulata]|uniref:Peptidyl-prolyl cis-trans isomerase n=1 Tax=Oryza meyeriana var. granulata TaxID=110450 RepID=A0A6G1EG13_9ORYZ|nr:hypothetical protein E2562_006606 [Oryza meyeriana var. granulata]